MFASLVSSLTSSLVSLCLVAPVAGPIAAPFVAPACPYCAGNRAIDYVTATDEIVRAPIAGVVHFAGPVGGRGYVTIRVGELFVTLGGLGEIDAGLRRSAVLRPGQVVGRAVGRDDPVSLSVRNEAGIHLDPTPWLGRLTSVGPRSRLVPVDGTPRRPAPRAVCRPGG
ncbi:MAG: hypothetical protein RIS41_1913 [Actinomycetota bacterium]